MTGWTFSALTAGLAVGATLGWVAAVRIAARRRERERIREARGRLHVVADGERGWGGEAG